MSKKISIKQFLMRTGRFKKAYDALSSIKEGRITINNKAVTSVNYFFNPKKSIIRFGEERLRTAKKLYFILNKPAGYVCQKSQNEKSIYEFIAALNLPKEAKSSLFSIGRLDKDTEGLLIITNDGKLADSVMNPKNEITKKYYAVLENPLVVSKIRILEKGIKLKGGDEVYKTRPSKIKLGRLETGEIKQVAKEEIMEKLNT